MDNLSNGVILKVLYMYTQEVHILVDLAFVRFVGYVYFGVSFSICLLLASCPSYVGMFGCWHVGVLADYTH